MTKNDNEYFKNSITCWICSDDYIDNVVKIRGHCQITVSAHRNCKNSGKFKIPAAFHNLKNCDSHLIMQELCKFNLKINVIPNELENYITINTINNKLSFIDSFQFLSS